MLGNYYLMIGNYSEAILEFERSKKFLNRDPGILQKLIICYCHLNNSQHALELLDELLNQAPNQNPVFQIAKHDLFINKNVETSNIVFGSAENVYQRNIISGILWSLYKPSRGLNYLLKALRKEPANEILKKVIEKLNANASLYHLHKTQ